MQLNTIHLAWVSNLSLILLLLSGCDKTAPGDNASVPPPPTVTVANPIIKEITDWDEFTGRLYAVESVEIRPRVSGYLESVNFVEGSIINKGDLLYVIDARPYRAVLEQARAEVSRAEAALDLANNDLARAERLKKTGAIAEETVDARNNQRREALATLQAAKAAVKAAALDVGFTKIHAPISGRIGRSRITQGNLITAGDNDSNILTTIVSLDPIYVYFSADEQSVLHYTRMDMAGVRQSSRISPNPVMLRLADEDDYMHQGHMDFVDNQIDLDTGTMRGRAIVDNPDFLLVPGMFADVKLHGEGPYDAILIPDTAINIDQTTQFVYVIDEKNVVARRQIKTGILHDGMRVIRDGLDQNDRVIINGLQRVRAGIEVNPEISTLENNNEIKS